MKRWDLAEAEELRQHVDASFKGVRPEGEGWVYCGWIKNPPDCGLDFEMLKRQAEAPTPATDRCTLPRPDGVNCFYREIKTTPT